MFDHEDATGGFLAAVIEASTPIEGPGFQSEKLLSPLSSFQVTNEFGESD